ncbi:MAG TPA: hypothetical protein VK250_04230 [Nitrososphaeraceae archaeon]|nr:hypothetical protein [Nitrososphaeraceae archaeon]
MNIELKFEESSTYSLFVFAVRSNIQESTIKKIEIFFNYIDLEPDKTMERRCNYFDYELLNNIFI